MSEDKTMMNKVLRVALHELQSKKRRKRKQEAPNTLNLAFSNYITYELIKERKSMKNPDHTYQCFTNFAKSVAEKWKNMSDSEKVIFQRAIYDGEEEEQGRKVKKSKKEKDPNAPKRALAAFVRFQTDQREIMKTDPNSPKNLPFTELAKLHSEKWKLMAPHEKEPYETASKIDFKKYKKDMAEYKKSLTSRP